jgi:hypothetical protein
MMNNSQALEYNWWRFVRHFAGPHRDGKWKAKQNRVLDKLAKTVCPPTALNIKPLKRVADISDEQLFREYIKPGIPVVLAGKAKDWECVKTWSPRWLAERYGDIPMTYLHSTPDEMLKGNWGFVDGKFGDVLEAIETGDRTKYLRFSPLLHTHPELLNGYYLKWLKTLRHWFSQGKKLQLFIGPKDSKTDWHCDIEYNLYTQIYGTKHWYLSAPKNDPYFDPLNLGKAYFTSAFDPASPDFERFPLVGLAEIYETTLEPGDIMYIPTSWWHQVENKSATVAVAFRWFNTYRSIEMSFIQTLLTILCYNPPIWGAVRMSKWNFAKMFARNHKFSNR